MNKILENLFKRASTTICAPQYQQIANLTAERDVREQKITSLQSELKDTQSKLSLMEAQATTWKTEYDNLKDNRTDLEKYLDTKYQRIPMIVYANKDYVQFPGMNSRVEWTDYLGNYITPGAYEVEKWRSTARAQQQGEDSYHEALAIANLIAHQTIYETDWNLTKSMDYYILPSVFLAEKHGDCEDHAFAFASIYQDAAVVYGHAPFGWHAWAAILVNGELYYVETTGENGSLWLAGKNNYKANYIFTKSFCWKIDGSVSFGTIAGGEYK